MSNVKNYLKRFFVFLLISCTIFLTGVGDYFGVRSMDVYATGTGAEALLYILEAAFASYGYSCSSQADLQSAADGFTYYVNNHTDTMPEAATAAAWKTFLTGDTQYVTEVYLSPEMFAFVQDSVEYLLAQNSSATITPDLSLSGVNYVDLSSINSFINSKYTVYDRVDDGAGTPVVTGIYDFDSEIENRKGFFIGVAANGSNVNFLFPSKADAVPVCVDGGLGYKFYSPSGGGYVSYEMRVFNVIDGILYFNYNDPTTLTHSYNTSLYYYYTSRTYSSVISSTTKVYSCVDEAKLAYKTQLIYPIAGKMYGSSSAAKTYSVDESTGTISIPITGTYTAAQVEQAIADALAANPSATQDDLDAIAAQIISSNAEIEDQIGESTETLAAMIQQVESIVNANALAIADLSAQVEEISVVNGTSAEKIESIADQFEVIEGGSSSGSEDDDPKVWLPVIPDVVRFLEPLLDFLGEPLSQITKFLNKIVNQIEKIPENVADAFTDLFNDIKTSIEALPSDIAEALNLADVISTIEEIPDLTADAFREFFGEIQAGIKELPQNIANAMPAINIPSLPDAINYTDVLNDILTSIQNIFLIDTSVLADHVSGLENVWAEKLPLMDNLSSLFDAFSFSDNYNYPVIQIATPAILAPYYSDDYIILLEFEKYKQYTLWCRNIVKTWLWFCFGLSVVNHFRTNISIG